MRPVLRIWHARRGTFTSPVWEMWSIWCPLHCYIVRPKGLMNEENPNVAH